MATAENPGGSRARQWGSMALRVSLSGALIAYVLGREGVGDAMRSAEQLPPAAVAASALLLLAYFACGALRWLVVLRAIGQPISLANALRISLIALFANQFLPSTIGSDAVRAWASTRAGIAMAATVNSILLDRLTHLVFLALLAAAAATATGLALPARAATVLWLLAAGSIASAAVLATMFAPAARLLPEAAARHFAAAQGQARQLFGSAGAMAAILATVAAGQLAFAGAAVAFANGMGASLAMADALVLAPIVVLLSSIPLSLGGWGVREVSMVVLFPAAGVPGPVALSVSLAIGLVTLAVSLPGAALAAWARRHSAGR